MVELAEFVDILEKTKKVFYLTQFIREGYSGCDKHTKKVAMEYANYFASKASWWNKSTLPIAQAVEKDYFDIKAKAVAFYEDPALKEILASIEMDDANSGKPFYVRGYFGRHWNQLESLSFQKDLFKNYLKTKNVETQLFFEIGSCLLRYDKIGIKFIFGSLAEATDFAEKNPVKDSELILMDTVEKIKCQTMERDIGRIYKTALTTCSMFIEQMYAELERNGIVTWPDLKAVAMTYAKNGTDAALKAARNLAAKGIISLPAARKWKYLIALEVSQVVGNLMPCPIPLIKNIPYGYTAAVV